MKQLFDSQEKAIRFIEYNSTDILKASRKAPVRCYFCTTCGGWYITSNPRQLHMRSKSEIAIEYIRNINIHKKIITKKIKEEKEKIKFIIEELPPKYEQTQETYLT